MPSNIKRVWAVTSNQAGLTAFFRIVREADCYGLDFTDGIFRANPTNPNIPVTGESTVSPGTYYLDTDPAWPVFSDGEYLSEFVNAERTVIYADGGVIEIEDDLVITLGSAVMGVPAEVWNYATRTLTSFASFVDDIWDYLTDNITITGSIGKFIKDSFNTLLASSGGNAFSIQVYITGGTTPIPAVQGVLRNSAETAVMEITTSGADGKLNYTVVDGTYKLYCYKRGSYTFTVPTTITVISGVASPAVIYGTAFSPSAPAEPGTCVVYGWLYGIDALVLAGATVEASLEDKRAWMTARKIAKMKISTTTDANGYWELELVPNSLLTPSGSKYTFSFSKDAYKYSERKTVPDSASKEYSILE